MPFYLRHVSPLRLNDGLPQCGVEDECQAVANFTLTSVLHQLSSLVLSAEDIFEELHDSFVGISDRAQALQSRIQAVREKVKDFKRTDAPIPEGGLCAFSQRTHHFSSGDVPPDGDLFSPSSRPAAIRRLYRRAVLSPVTVLRQLDSFRNDGLRCSKFFTCTPTSQPAVEKLTPPLDIETRLPESLDLLPDWAEDEEELTSPIHPDTRLGSLGRPGSEAAGHRLPRPDQVTRARSQRFPAQVVPVDVTGHGFERQLQFRRSLVQYDYVKKRRKRRSRQRRNTISDSSDLRAALQAAPTAGGSAAAAGGGRRVRTDDRQTQTELRAAHSPSVAATGQRLPRSPRSTMADVELPRTDASAPLGRLVKLSPPEQPAYTATNVAGGGGGWPGPAALRRRPAAVAAAASEASSSGRGSSGGSDLASADLEPRVVSPADSGTAVSPAEEKTGSPRRRLASPTDSGLSDGGRAEESCASDETVTPEYGDGDTSSVFSCDAEGYYTSFHIDSGLRGAPPPPPPRPDSRSSTVSAASSVAGPRRRPAPPPRASSLDPAHRGSVTPARAGAGAGRARSPGSSSLLSGSETDAGEQFRCKTALTSGRIPSMCVVTPPVSEGSELGSPGRGRAWDTASVASRDRDRDRETDSDRERTPRPDDGVGSGWVGDAPTGRPLKAPWGAPLSDWTSSETGDSSGGTRTPPLVRPEAEGEEHSGGAGRAPEAAASTDTASLARLNGTESWCSSSRSLLSGADLAYQMASLAVSPPPPPPPPTGARYGSCQEMPVYDAPLPVRPAGAAPHRYQYRPGSYSAPASPLTGPRALPRHQRASVDTADRRPTDAGVRCAAAPPAGLRRASVAGAAPCSSAAWSPADTLDRRVSDSAVSSPTLSRAGSLDRRAVRRYTAAAAARLYSSLRLLRGKRPSTAAPAPAIPASSPGGETRPAPESGQTETGRWVASSAAAAVPAQYQYSSGAEYGPAGPPQPSPALRPAVPSQAAYQQPGPALGDPERRPYQQAAAEQQPAQFRHPSPMPQQRRPPEQRYTLRQYAQLVANYRLQQQQQQQHQHQQQHEQQQQYQQQNQQQQRQGQGVNPPPAGYHTPEPWQTEGHYQSPRLTWVPSSPRQVSLNRHLQVLSQGRHPPHTPDQVRRSPRPPPPPPVAAGEQGGDTATADRQPPAPQNRAAPFSFGRYSLRLRGSEPTVPEPRRPAEAEQLLQGPGRQPQPQPQPQQKAVPSRPSDEIQKVKRPKKRWFFTLPGKSKRDKNKSKTEESSDDDGGFAPAGGGGGGGGESSFVRYESPDSVSSGVSSRASTPLTDASVSSSYFEMEQYFPSLNTSQGSGPVVRPLSSLSEDSRSLRCQSSPQMRAPRPPNFSQLEYSPPEAAAAAAAAAEWRRQGPGAPVAQSPRPGVRLGPLPPLPSRPAADQQRQWAHQTPRPPAPATAPAPSGGSQIYGNPTVFSQPRPAVVAAAGRGWPPASTQHLSEPGQRASWAGGGGGGGPRGAPAGQRSSWSGGPPTPRSPGRAQLTRPTPLNDFKELIARQSRSPAGGSGGSGTGRGSATERLRAVTASPASPAASPAPQSPFDARNSARAVLFQSRFGGRRCRPPGTSVMATTIPETEDELSEEPLPPPQPPASRRQLFAVAGDSRSSSNSSPDRAAAAAAVPGALRMSPSSPPPPYSSAADGRLLPSGLASERHFTPVTGPGGGFRRSYSLPRRGDDQRPPIGSISRYQFQNRPGVALTSASTAASPFQRSRSLMARLPNGGGDGNRGGGRPDLSVAPGPTSRQSATAAASRVETAI